MPVRSYKHIFASLIKFPRVRVWNKGPSLSVLPDDCAIVEARQQ